MTITQPKQNLPASDPHFLCWFLERQCDQNTQTQTVPRGRFLGKAPQRLQPRLPSGWRACLPLLSASLLSPLPTPVSPGRLRVAPCSSARVRIADRVYGPTFSCPEKHGRTQRRTHTRSRCPPPPHALRLPTPQSGRSSYQRTGTNHSPSGRGGVPGELTTASLSRVVLGVCLCHGPPLLVAPAR